MPNTPKRETILQYVITLMKTITKPAYYNNIGDDQVTRTIHTLEDIESAEMPMILVTPGDETAQVEGGKFIDKRRYLFEMFVLGFIHSDDPRDAGRDLENFIWDVRSVLQNDPGLGSNAIDSEIVQIRSDIGVVGYPQYGVFVLEMVAQYDSPHSSP